MWKQLTDPTFAALVAIRHWHDKSSLARCALDRTGFGDSNGGFGIRYPDEPGEHSTGRRIPPGFVLAYGFWGPPEGYEVLVPEWLYRDVLAEVLGCLGRFDEAASVRMSRGWLGPGEPVPDEAAGSTPVLFCAGPGMPGDHVSIRRGFDGEEPSELVAFHRECGAMLEHLCVAVNTAYPDVLGGHYVNRNLLGLIQDALDHLGLAVVLRDIYGSQATTLPVEARCALVEQEEYLLLDRATRVICGGLMVWSFDAAGAAFYRTGTERWPVSLFIPLSLADELVEALRRVFTQANVPVEIVDPATAPAREPDGILRSLGRFFGI